MPSLQLAQLKEFQSSSIKPNNNIQFNKSLIALNPMETVDVKQEEWTSLSTMLEIKVIFSDNLGLNTWAAYPYTGVVGTCQSSTGLFKIGGYTNVTDCTTLANALTVRPISVAVDGNNFQFYKSGVFYNCANNLSLAVLLVGMTDSFWVLKNSWGTAWGESGYIRIARGNTCGVCQVGSYPYVK